MNIDEEKTYIYSMMREITEERRRLTDIYYSLKNRLDSLHQLEQMGLEKLSIKGYIDLYNQYSKNQNQIAIANIERETKHVINELSKNNLNNPEQEKEEQDLVKEVIIPKSEIEIEKDKEPRKRSHLNLDKVTDVIISVLKEAGVPMPMQALYEKVCEKLNRDINPHNFRANIMPRAMQKNNKIQRVMRGYYQYKP